MPPRWPSRRSPARGSTSSSRPWPRGRTRPLCEASPACTGPGTARPTPSSRRSRRRWRGGTRHPPLALHVDDDLPARATRAVLAALPARTRVVPWAGPATEDVAPGTQVVLLAAHRVDPRRAGPLVRDDVTHVPLVLDGSGARIGPVVAPGRTACLACLDADQRRHDPDWATVAAQLIGRPRPEVDVALAAEAGRAARFLLTAPIGRTTRSLHLRGDSFRRAWTLHQPSADCHCRSPEGIATETAHPRPRPRAQLTDNVRAARVTPTYARRRSSSTASNVFAYEIGRSPSLTPTRYT